MHRWLDFKTSVSPVDHSVCPTEAKTAIGKQCILFSLSAHLLRPTHFLCHCIMHSQISPPTHDLKMSVNKCCGIDCGSEIWPLPLARPGFGGCSNFVILCMLSWGLWSCVFPGHLLGRLYIILEAALHGSSTTTVPFLELGLSGSCAFWFVLLGFYFIPFLSYSCLAFG